MKNVFLAMIILLCLASCKKEDNLDNSSTSKSEYLPLSIGNYWVYKIFDNNLEEDTSYFAGYDSLIISKDTLIGNETYYRFDHFSNWNNKFVFDSSYYYRDSSKYLIDNYGQKLFSEVNFTDTLRFKTQLAKNDTVYTISFKMEALSTILIVDAGEFDNLLNFKGTVICSPKFTKIPNPRFTSNYYAKGVGKVYFSNNWVASGGDQTHWLARYKVQ